MWQILLVLGLIDKLIGKGGSIKYYEKKLHEYQEHEADTLVDLGVLYLEKERFDEALESFKKALETYRKLDDKEGEAFVLDLIGDTYISMRKIDKALEYYQSSFKLYSSIRSSLKNEMLEKIKEVEDIKKAIEIAAEEEEKASVSPFAEYERDEYVTNYDKITEKLEEAMGMLETVSMYERYPKEDAMKYLKEALNVSHEIGDKKEEATILLMMGDVLLREKKTDEALKYFKKAFDIFSETGNKKEEALSLLFIGGAYSMLEDADKTFDAFRRSFEIFRELGYKHGEYIAMDLINAI